MTVTSQEMQKIYEEMKTPVKYGMVLCEEGANIDCPNVIRAKDGSWRMIYAKHIPGAPREGYETWMARSDDLLSWETMGRLLSHKDSGWDCLQADGGLCLLDPTWNGPQSVEKYNGKYWMAYIGGSLPGYETEPLHIGLAASDNLQPGSWEQFPEPILRMDDPDVRPFEKSTLFKSTVIRDPQERLGYPFVMYYNAKQQGIWIERIGMAVSSDMLHWKRYGEGAVIELGRDDIHSICGDPQIIRFGDLWVMNYFVAYEGRAWDTFARSRDLVHWTKWEGCPLIEASEDYDTPYAHKPYILKADGRVFHFYCAVGSQGRGIAVAFSE